MHRDIRSVQVCSKLTMEHLNSNYPVWIKKNPIPYMSYIYYFYPIYQRSYHSTTSELCFFPSGLLICDKFGLIFLSRFLIRQNLHARKNRLPTNQSTSRLFALVLFSTCFSSVTLSEYKTKKRKYIYFIG